MRHRLLLDKYIEISHHLINHTNLNQKNESHAGHILYMRYNKHQNFQLISCIVVMKGAYLTQNNDYRGHHRKGIASYNAT